MYDEQEEIEENIIRMDDENDTFNLELSEEQSFTINKSVIQFKKEDIIISKSGVKNFPDSPINLQQFQMNPSCFNLAGRKQLGKGSAGVVYLASYEKDGHSEPVAIKEIQVHDKKSREQFINQLKAGMNNRYQNNFIVKFYGCYYKNYCIYEVFQYMDLKSLRDLIQFQIEHKLFLNEESLAEICANILRALNYIHKIQQIHRDIKPENILLNSKGQLKITDFGIFKQLRDSVLETSTYCGTIEYISPELTENYHSFKTDIWSFGLVLFQMATNLPNPYREKYQKYGEYVYARKLKSDPPPTIPQQFNRSPQLVDFLGLCLQINPNKRADEQQLLNHAWIKNNAGKVSLKVFFQQIYSKTH